MFRNETHNNTKIIQLVFFFLGILAITIGLYATEPRLVQFALRFSSDKALDEGTIALLQGFRIKVILLAVVLVLLSMATGYIVQFKNSIIRKFEPGYLIEGAISLIGRFLDSIYKIGTNEKVLWSFVVLVLISLPFQAIFFSPAGGFHVEGIDLQPAKNLARHGIYATLTTRGFDELTHRSSAGPGIILPNALIFKLFGINVHYSRALHLAFIIGTIIVFHRMARDLYGKKAALLAVVISLPWMIMLSRGHAGMGPEGYLAGFFYFLVGALFWFKSIDTKRNIYLIVSGLFWALSFQTKWLYLFAIFALILTCIVLTLSNNGLKSKYYLIPTSMVFLVTGAWIVFRIFNVGLGQELSHLVDFWNEHGRRAIGVGTEQGIASSIFAVARPLATLLQNSQPTIPSFLRIDLWGDLQLFLIIPAILYVMILIGKSKMTDYKNLFFINFTLIWFIWWLFFNFDLPEVHLRVFLLMSQLFVAKLLYDAWIYSSEYGDGFLNLVKKSETEKTSMFYLLRVAIVCIVLGKVLLPLFEKGNFLYISNLTLTKPINEMMGYIKTNTEKNAVFSGWRWSLPWYVDLDDDGDRIIKDRSTYPPEQREAVPEYFIVSPEWPLLKVTEEWPSVVNESSGTFRQNEIRKKFLAEQCTLVKTFGEGKHKWLLYKVNNDKLAQLSQK